MPGRALRQISVPPGARMGCLATEKPLREYWPSPGVRSRLHAPGRYAYLAQALAPAWTASETARILVNFRSTTLGGDARDGRSLAPWTSDGTLHPLRHRPQRVSTPTTTGLHHGESYPTFYFFGLANPYDSVRARALKFARSIPAAPTGICPQTHHLAHSVRRPRFENTAEDWVTHRSPLQTIRCPNDIPCQ